MTYELTVTEDVELRAVKVRMEAVDSIALGSALQWLFAVSKDGDASLCVADLLAAVLPAPHAARLCAARAACGAERLA